MLILNNIKPFPRVYQEIDKFQLIIDTAVLLHILSQETIYITYGKTEIFPLDIWYYKLFPTVI